MDATGYAQMLAALLPEGVAWPTSDQTDGESGFDKLLRALAQEPARLDAVALGLLEQVYPDNDDTDLDAWEVLLGAPTSSLTDAERLARIQGVLLSRGRVNLASLQAVARARAGDSNVTLHHWLLDPFACGSGAGGHIGDLQRFAWALRYMPSSLNAGPNSFEEWSATASVTQDAAQSPIKETAVADRVYGTFTVKYDISTEISNTANNDNVRVALWARAVSEPCSFSITLMGRDSVAVAGSAKTITLKADLWQKVWTTGNVGSGASEPEVLCSWDDPSSVYLADAYAGIRNLDLEEFFTAQTPIQTRGWFMVQGEDT